MLNIFTAEEVRLVSEIFSVHAIIPYTKIATAIIEGKTKKKPPMRLEILFLSIFAMNNPSELKTTPANHKV